MTSYYLTQEASDLRLQALVTRLASSPITDLPHDFYKVPEEIQLRVIKEIENDRARHSK